MLSNFYPQSETSNQHVCPKIFSLKIKDLSNFSLDLDREVLRNPILSLALKEF